MTRLTNRQLLNLFSLLVDNLNDVILTPAVNGMLPDGTEVYSPSHQLKIMDNRFGVAWCRLAAIAECLGPNFVEVLHEYRIPDAVIVEDMIREAAEESPPLPAPTVN